MDEIKELLRSEDKILLLEKQLEFQLLANKFSSDAQNSYFESEAVESRLFEDSKAEGLSDERAKYAMKADEQRLLSKSKMIDEDEKAKNNQIFTDLIATKLRFICKP
jgi:hypothetical protein